MWALNRGSLAYILWCNRYTQEASNNKSRVSIIAVAGEINGIPNLTTKDDKFLMSLHFGRGNRKPGQAHHSQLIGANGKQSQPHRSHIVWSNSRNGTGNSMLWCTSYIFDLQIHGLLQLAMEEARMMVTSWTSQIWGPAKWDQEQHHSCPPIAHS